MRPFRFRAQTALQLRRREHDEALAALARAQTALAVARHDLAEAEEALRDAERRLADAIVAPPGGTPREWYQSWRVRCEQERARREAHRQSCEAEEQRAAEAVTATYRRLRALERLHDIALARWQHEARREEQKAMDAMAANRFFRKDTW